METLVGTAHIHTRKFTAADLGLTTSLVGAGTLVTLVDVVPKGWTVWDVAIRRDGDITNGSGTTVASVGMEGDSGTNNVIVSVDIEGSGVAYLAPTVIKNDPATPLALQALVTTATAAPSAVAGLTFIVELRKTAREN